MANATKKKKIVKRNATPKSSHGRNDEKTYRGFTIVLSPYGGATVEKPKGAVLHVANTIASAVKWIDKNAAARMVTRNPAKKAPRKPSVPAPAFHFKFFPGTKKGALFFKGNLVETGITLAHAREWVRANGETRLKVTKP